MFYLRMIHSCLFQKKKIKNNACNVLSSDDSFLPTQNKKKIIKNNVGNVWSSDDSFLLNHKKKEKKK